MTERMLVRRVGGGGGYITVDTPVDLGPLLEAVAALQQAQAVRDSTPDTVLARLAEVETRLAKVDAVVAALPPGITRKP